MFDWLFEGRPSVYIALGGAAILLLVVWWQQRKRWCLIGVAVAVASIGLYALLDYTVETDREQITRKIKEMAAGVSAHKLDATFVHISDRFRSPGGKGKQELRSAAESYLNSKTVESVDVWDILLEERPAREKGEARVRFSAKVHGVQEFFTDCEAIFDFHPEHGWRLKTFRLVKPQTNEEWSWQI